MAMQVAELKPAIGSEIRVSREELLGGGLRDAIRELLVARGVIVFRDIDLTDEEQRGLARQLGDLRTGTVSKEGDEGLMKVTLNPRENPDYVDFFPGSLLWHMDGTYDVVPPFATMLRPIRIARHGGQTEFCSTYAAYEALGAAQQAEYDRLQCVHTMLAAMVHAVPDAPVEKVQRWMSYPDQVHPLVWQHRSGRKSLALSTSCSHVVGMHPADSHDFLSDLMRHATQDAFVYRHEWQPGDLLMWDNTGTMHRGRPYDAESDRLLHRFTLNGEEPITAVSA